MPKATASYEPRRELTEEEQEASAVSFLNSITLLSVPTTFFKFLSDEAAKRNMTVTELLRKAIFDYLDRTDPRSPSSVLAALSEE